MSSGIICCLRGLSLNRLSQNCPYTTVSKESTADISSYLCITLLSCFVEYWYRSLEMDEISSMLLHQIQW